MTDTASGTTSSDHRPTVTPRLACVVLAHADPVQVRRLIAALDPFPVLLHCDVKTEGDVFAAMTADLPDRCVVLPRMRTAWARWPMVEAELAGYRAALAHFPEATHVALLTGADYPMRSTPVISRLLAGIEGRSVLRVHPLPYANWGRSGGLSRLRFPHTAFRRHIVRFPLPRRLPAGVGLAGGSQLKILAAHHVQAVLRTVDERPDLVGFWRRSWCPDETFVASLLNTPAFTPDWASSHLAAGAWYISWNRPRQKSPPWLGLDDLPEIEAALDDPDVDFPVVFARKFATAHDTEVLDRLDARRHAELGVGR